MPRRWLTADERALWRQVTADVRPLEPERSEPIVEVAVPEEPAAAPPPPRQARIAAAPAAPRVATPPRPPAELTSGQAAGLDRRRMERLKRGQLPIDAVVDLHGMTQAAAHRRIEHVVADSAAAGLRCLLVITGKGAQGGGILRQRLADWLNLPATRPHVLAFVEARPEHGGGGAFYVLLRRKR